MATKLMWCGVWYNDKGVATVRGNLQTDTPLGVAGFDVSLEVSPDTTEVHDAARALADVVAAFVGHQKNVDVVLPGTD